MIIVLTGNGKGKTTASLGQMVRATGRGKRVLMIQFIKGPWRSGEDEFAKRFKIPKSRFQIKKMGFGFVGILGDKLPREVHRKAAEDGLSYFEKARDLGKWDLIILDEINNAVGLGLLDVQVVRKAAEKFPKGRLLILSGRGAKEEIVEIADLATEMREIKHPYRKGKLAEIGVEY